MQHLVGIAPAVTRRVDARAEIVHTHGRKAGHERRAIEKIGLAAILALDRVIGHEQADVLRRHDEEVASLDPIDRSLVRLCRHQMREATDEIDREIDIRMFSGQENWTRHPPDARSVEQCS